MRIELLRGAVRWVSMAPESDRPLGLRAEIAVRIAGWMAFLIQASFPLIAKGGSWGELAAWGVGSVSCIAGTAFYAGAGYWWLLGRSRSSLRSTFRGFILGFATLCGIIAFLFWSYLYLTL